MDKLAIVMPVYNEEGSIGPVLDKWISAMDEMGIDYTINPYNDGSQDHSGQIIQDKAKEYPGKIVAHEKNNSGHGPTILQGYREAAETGYDWVFQIDSDDEMGPEGFAELWNRRNDYDFLVGIRDGRKQVLSRKIISVVSRLSVRIFYGKSVWDVNTPYRLMRVSAFREVWQKIPADTFAPNVIISGMAARMHLCCFEARVPQRDRQTGEVSIKKWKLFKAAAKSFWQTIAFSILQQGAQTVSLLKKIRFFLLIVFGIVSVGLLAFHWINISYVKIETDAPYYSSVEINGTRVKMDGKNAHFWVSEKVTPENLQIRTSDPSKIDKIFFAGTPFFITYLNRKHFFINADRPNTLMWNKKAPSHRFSPVSVIFIITLILAMWPFLLSFWRWCQQQRTKLFRYISVLGIITTVFSFLIFLCHVDSFALFVPAVYGTDSAVFQVIGTSILDGCVPYRDIFDHKGPLLYLFNAVGALAGGQWGLFAVECIAWVSTLFFLHKALVLISGRKNIVNVPNFVMRHIII